MTKILIGALVGTIITFAFSAMSWMFLGIHKHSLKYTESQDMIMESINSSISEDGVYFMPYADPDKTSEEEMHKLREENQGKAWAMLSYHSAWEENIGMNMARGFIYNFIAMMMVALVMWYGRSGMKTFGQRWMAAFAFAVFMIFQGHLYNSVWWETPWHFLSGELIDTTVSYALAAFWLAWYVKE